MLIENKSALQITLTLLFGDGNIETITLPTNVAIPTVAFTMPRPTSPPLLFDRIIAGNAALYMDAIKFIAAKNKIKENYRFHPEKGQ